MKASARSIHLKNDHSLKLQEQKKSQTSPTSPPMKTNSIEGSSLKEKISEAAQKSPVDGVISIASVPMEIDSSESRKRQSPDDRFKGTKVNRKENSPSLATGESLGDVYNWRKYGEKHLKGNESSRAYYKCSHPGCEAKKQVLRSYDGQTNETTYKGNHNHLTPQTNNEMAIVKVSNPHSQTAQTKSKDAPDLSLTKDGENKDAGLEANRKAGKVAGNDDHLGKSKSPLEIQGQSESPQLGQSSSAKISTPTTTSNILTLSVNVPNSPRHVVTSRAIVPVEVDPDELQRRQVLGSIVQAMPSDRKGPLMAAERLSEDGYNWRKYGQKRISGSEFPRSYYRCTHPNCQVKKQLERSHDGTITETIYKGNHDHPKPEPSSKMVVGTILSIQEESDRVSSNIKNGKASNGDCVVSCDSNPNNSHDPSLVSASDNGVEGQGPQLPETRKEVNDDDNPESNNRCLISKTEASAASLGSNHQQNEPSLQIQVYMVTSRDDLPNDADSGDRRQRETTDSGLQATSGGSSTLIPAERLPDDVYNWRKYGQKLIKGNEFPRSYYRCTYPDCQVKKQLGLSRDGRIIEIIYKGKHNHPKPLPRGAVLSIQEEKSDNVLHLNDTKDNPSNADSQTQTSHYIKIIGSNELAIVAASDHDIETAGAQSNSVSDGVEGDDDRQSKRRKKDVDDLDVTSMGRTTREPRVVVENLSEVDVVDDGFRWHKYGRKMVKGNPNPRNYYRCSNLGCSAKKHVERSSSNPKLLITTYEGKHNHDTPAPRPSTSDTANLDHGAVGESSPDNEMIEKQHSPNPEPPVRNQPQTAEPAKPAEPVKPVEPAELDSGNMVEGPPTAVDLQNSADVERPSKPQDESSTLIIQP